MRWRRRARAVFYGNCQAGAVSGLLERTPAFARRHEVVPVRGVHEVTVEQVERVRAAFASADVVVTQAVRDGYHELPLGSEQMLALCGPGVRVIRIPKLYSPLFPFLVYYNGPVSAVRGAMHYGDVRAVARASGVDTPPEPDGIRALAAASLERSAAVDAAADVHVSARAFAPGVRERAMFTTNHPRRVTLELLRAGVLEQLGLPVEPLDDDEEPLDGYRAPLEPPVIEALGLDATPGGSWTTPRGPVGVDDLIAADAAMLASRPEVLEVTRRFQAERLAALWPDRFTA